MSRIKLTQCTQRGVDETAGYSVSIQGELTVREFVREVLDLKEWGYIGIEAQGAIFGDPKCEYDRDTLKYSLPDDVLGKKVVSARASGGWSRMDYLLTLE